MEPKDSTGHYTELVECTPHTRNFKTCFKISSHLRLELLSLPFPLGFLTNILYVFHLCNVEFNINMDIIGVGCDVWTGFMRRWIEASGGLL
jgi:hypothetical protein